MRAYNDFQFIFKTRIKLNVPSNTGGFVVLESNLGPVIVITIAPRGAVMTIDMMQTLITISAYFTNCSICSSLPVILRTSSSATGAKAACKYYHLFQMSFFIIQKQIMGNNFQSKLFT